MHKKPVFIHSLFRTGSTYIWNTFRQNDKYRCYYEPLHPVLAKITPGNIEDMMSNDYRSVNHPELARHYLDEYRPLLKNGETGLPYYKKAFGFDQFCWNKKNPALKQYIDSLITGSHDKIPVLKFNRTAFRVRWFKENYPRSLNIYLTRHPHDQWQSYFELYNRTGYTGFFVMDLLIPSVNKDSEDYRRLSGLLPLITYNNDRPDKEDDFYRIILDSYSMEERYVIFYYTWFRAIVENVLHADFILNINLLSKDTSYREKVIKFLRKHRIDGINFEDAGVKEYSSYPLPLGSMARIEDSVRGAVIPSFTGDQLNHFSRKITKDDKTYSRFYKRWAAPTHRDGPPSDSSEPPGQGKAAEKLKRMILLFAEEYFTRAKKELILKNLVETRDLQLDGKNRQVGLRVRLLAEKNHVIYKKDRRLAEMDAHLGWMDEELKQKGMELISLKKQVELLGRENRALFNGKVNLLDGGSADFGRHRSGWHYGLHYLRKLHSHAGTTLDSFIERTFCWRPGGNGPHLEPWIGFIHVPPKVPRWFHYEQANETMFRSVDWKRSVRHCKGLFTLSAYHKKYLETELDVPVESLLLPTESTRTNWSWDAFIKNKEIKIVQVGWWLRKLHAIYQLPQTGYKKILLSVGHESLPRLMKSERDILIREGTFKESMYHTAETVTYLTNGCYDRLLSENIVFIDLYDASANNTIVECIVRNTPILVNPLEAVKEYLGGDYPFYYDTYEDAAAKAQDFDRVYQAHRYLSDHPIKEKLTGEYFLKSFINSEIYKNL